MPPKRRLRKIVDEESLVSCINGPGLVRKEVWEDGSGKVVRYNLAFINHFMTASDRGRVLGYDNAHGEPHRHFFGRVYKAPEEDYDAVVARFLDEVAVLRRQKEMR